jgi:AcrR family transcriptional regulator
VHFELPLLGPDGSAAERADAARNRERILTVATELVGARGIDAVSMQEIARSAGVGAGTVYRRFGDRAGLALALLDAETREFQETLLRGAPPIGPGAPAVDRLKAFGGRYLEVLDVHAQLFVAAEGVPEDRHGPTSFYLTHLAMLLREACPEQDAEHVARVLLAGFGPREIVHWRTVLGWPLLRVQAGWDALVDALARP